jgi:hypothetical protein
MIEKFTLRNKMLYGAIVFTLLIIYVTGSELARADSSSITLTPDQGPSPNTIEITGKGFVPGQKVDILFKGGVIARFTPDTNGNFRGSINIPAGLGDGSHKVDANDGFDHLASADYRVVTPTPTPAPTIQFPVPESPLAALGAILVLAVATTMFGVYVKAKQTKKR